MANDPIKTGYTLAQNPSPFPETGQDFIDKVRNQTGLIMAQFLKVLPSNYVSTITGPFYTLRFQAAAEQLAAFQITAQEVFKDSDYAFTRPEFLWQVLGVLVFPGGTDQSGIPRVDGDVAYRDFLRKMVLLLLRGATPSAVEEGAGLLTEADVTLLERFLEARQPGSEFTIDDQFFFDILVEEAGGTAFPPEDPFVLQENVRLILEALKPAHTLYGYSHLFREVFGPLFSDTYSWELSTYYYDDLRKFCYGTREITGTEGVTLSGRMAFSDPNRSFRSVQAGGILHVTSGPNIGRYRIRDVVAFLVNDATARAYTTAPSGLVGTATVNGDVITDATQDFGGAVEGEVLTLTAGPNAGSYRLETLLGSDGGAVGFATGPATQVRVSPSIIRVETRMPSVASGQSYSVDVDRLGERVPKVILAEDAAEQFYL